jgi:hypothetical protein
MFNLVLVFLLSGKNQNVSCFCRKHISLLQNQLLLVRGLKVHYYRVFFAPNINMHISTERGGRVSTLSGLGTNVIKVH